MTETPYDEQRRLHETTPFQHQDAHWVNRRVRLFSLQEGYRAGAAATKAEHQEAWESWDAEIKHLMEEATDERAATEALAVAGSILSEIAESFERHDDARRWRWALKAYNQHA